MNIEDILRLYPVHVCMLKNMRTMYDALISYGDVEAQKYSERVDAGGSIKKPVEDYVQKKESIQSRISELEALTEPISALMFDLALGHVEGILKDYIMLEILKSHYWNNEPLIQTAQRLRLSRSRIRMYKDKLTGHAEKRYKERNRRKKLSQKP